MEDERPLGLAWVIFGYLRSSKSKGRGTFLELSNNQCKSLPHFQILKPIFIMCLVIAQEFLLVNFEIFIGNEFNNVPF